MKRLNQLLLMAFVLLFTVQLAAQNKTYNYITVPNDPLNARIYTLDNGLKIYMTVYKETPRIQTFIAVKVGGKNDPAETTGLAHYFEHIMFKGTKQFGTKDYAQEEPFLNKIEELFEKYRKTSDTAERTAIYKQIDETSYQASLHSLPNEYDRLMSAIGAKGTNAYTGYDMTVYIEDIPSNQIDNWAKIQSDRFTNPVIRGFHTELETVYEEKNMSLTQDGRKVYETILSSLFPNHPYGTQTVLGTQEHLKNPSITNIKNYFKQYYVANNMAICLSGDFDPENMIQTIDKYFGNLPQAKLPELHFTAEKAITTPVVKEVFGNETEDVHMAWRFPGAKDKDTEMLQLFSYLLYNGKAGLIDLNVNQKQIALGGGCGGVTMTDYSGFILSGRPKTNQTLDEVKAILLAQIDSIKQGKFADWLIEATVNNFKLSQIKQLENNRNRANMFVNTFVNGLEWQDEVQSLDRISKVSKQQIIDFANKYFTNNNYVTIYKRQGKDPNEQKMSKPSITPIFINRDDASSFLTEVQNAKVQQIEPVFLDYSKDMGQFTTKHKLPVLYKQNTENDLFALNYVFDMGTNNDKALGMAFSYLNYLGTSKYTPEEIKSQFYKMACSFSVSSGTDRVYVSLNGLNENMDKALALFEELLADPKINEPALVNLVSDIKKSRNDAKLNQQQIFGQLTNYATWGDKSPRTNVLSSVELDKLTGNDLIARIKNLKNYEHTVMYYGPRSEKDIKRVLDTKHAVAKILEDLPESSIFRERITKENNVMFVNYDAKQLYLGMVSKRGEKYDITQEPINNMYNTYFGGGMSSIVFQEMREARGLAYSAGASFRKPARLDQTYTMSTFIATQNDKLDDAYGAFHQIINDMPESKHSFDIAKNEIISGIRTERITRMNVLFNYLSAKDFKRDYDLRKDIFEKTPSLTLDDVKKYQQENIKNRTYTYCVLGDEKDMTDDVLKKYGKVQRLSLEDVFGY